MMRKKESILWIIFISLMYLLILPLVWIGQGINCCGVAGEGNGFLSENYDDYKMSVICAEGDNIYIEGYVEITLNESVKKQVSISITSNGELLVVKNITDKTVKLDLHHIGVGGFSVNILNPNNNSFRINDKYSVRILNIDVLVRGIIFLVIGVISVLLCIFYIIKKV